MALQVQSCPIEHFQQWFEEAHHCGLKEPTAVSLATASKDAAPSCRIVLLKGIDERGFVIYTNKTSRKGQELLSNPQAALCFYWMPLNRQVRVEGKVEEASEGESNNYFDTRRRESRLGAWASLQSQPMAKQDDLRKRLAEQETHFDGKPVHRPEHWGGFRIIPHRIEFWQEGEFRLHERLVYSRDTETEQTWQTQYLYP